MGKKGLEENAEVTRGGVRTPTVSFAEPVAEVARRERGFGMEKYIDEMLEEAPAEFSQEVKTCAASHLFNVNEECPKLDKERKDIFHHLVAKCMFLCKRARPDIQLPVAFLATRVQDPNEDDWKKLGRMICFIRGYRDVLTLEAKSFHVMKWWIDASYAAHPDRRSHTGGVLMPGKGAVIAKSSKQKINMKSSTEAELVGADDLIGDVIWTRMFLQWQGWGATDNIVYQDNESAMKLEVNGKASSTKRTKHIDIKYFFITDRVKAGDSRVVRCPTLEMIADFFTKPLQGSLFHKFRDVIMNIARKVDETRSISGSELTTTKMDVDSRKGLPISTQECVTRGGVRTPTVSFAEPVAEVARRERGFGMRVHQHNRGAVPAAE